MGGKKELDQSLSRLTEHFKRKIQLLRRKEIKKLARARDRPCYQKADRG